MLFSYTIVNNLPLSNPVQVDNVNSLYKLGLI